MPAPYQACPFEKIISAPKLGQAQINAPARRFGAARRLAKWMLLDAFTVSKPELTSCCFNRQIAYDVEVPYRVLIDDNFQYQDDSERVSDGEFETAAEAITACHKIINDFLADAYRSGMNAAALYEQFTLFGDDPFITPLDPNDAPLSFSAWSYAKQQCEAIATKSVNAKPGSPGGQ